MKKFLNITCIFIFLTLIFSSCNPSDPIVLPTPATYTNNVNVLFQEYTAGGAILKYWKNGVSTNLTNGSYFPIFGDMVIENNDVYIAGQVLNDRAGYWKNGSVTQLSNNSSYTKAIAVSGTDVYISGSEFSNACFWKNGVLQPLPLTNTTDESVASDVAVSGTDVHVVGQERGSIYKAKYWKNGVVTNLATGLQSSNCQARSIVISGTDVYIAGTANNQATYWKNGVATTLSTVNFSQAYKIYLDGLDVYVIGSISNSSTGCYWKNGILMYAPNLEFYNDFAKMGSDSYFVGVNINNKPLFTQNGVETFLTNNVDGLAFKIIVN